MTANSFLTGKLTKNQQTANLWVFAKTSFRTHSFADCLTHWSFHLLLITVLMKNQILGPFFRNSACFLIFHETWSMKSLHFVTWDIHITFLLDKLKENWETQVGLLTNQHWINWPNISTFHLNPCTIKFYRHHRPFQTLTFPTFVSTLLIQNVGLTTDPSPSFVALRR